VVHSLADLSREAVAKKLDLFLHDKKLHLFKGQSGSWLVGGTMVSSDVNPIRYDKETRSVLDDQKTSLIRINNTQ